jgi:hypothetical protein
MKKLLLFLLFLEINSVNGIGQKFNDLRIEPIVGVRLNDYNFQNPEFPVAFQIFSTPILGAEIQVKNSPFSLTYLTDRTYTIYNAIVTEHGISNLTGKSIGNLIQFKYQRKILRYGIGHYWLFHEDFSNYLISFSKRTRHLSFSIDIPMDNVEIEYLSLVKYTRGLGIGRFDLQSINFKYHFNQKNKEGKSNKKNVTLNLITGTRLFYPNKI